MGSMMTAFAEGMALAKKGGLKQEELLEVLSLGALNNPLFSLKGNGLISHNYPPAFPLKHQQKDMRLAIALGEYPFSVLWSPYGNIPLDSGSAVLRSLPVQGEDLEGG